MEAKNPSLVAVGGGALAKPDFPARPSPSFLKLFWVAPKFWRLLGGDWKVFRQKNREEKTFFVKNRGV